MECLVFLILLVSFQSSLAHLPFSTLHHQADWDLTLTKAKFMMKSRPPAKHITMTRREAGQGIDLGQRCVFHDVVNETVNLISENYQGQGIILHTIVENHDMLILINSTYEVRSSIEAATYTEFMALSHLPVTAITILLPDLLKYNYTLLSNFSKSETFTRLKKFQESTLKLLQGSIITGTPDEEGQSVAVEIVEKVSLFVNRTLLDPSSVTEDSIRSFTDSLQPNLKRAAKFALEDYFKILNAIINATFDIDMTTDLNVVIAVRGFSYSGSFLAQYYENLLGSTFGDDVSMERIAFMKQPLCGTNEYSTDLNSTTSDSEASRRALSNTTFSHAISKTFTLFPVHSLLSDVAKEMFEPVPEPHLVFQGFNTAAERVYVILIVTALSTVVVLLVVVLSIYCEDKVITMESKPAEITRKDPKEASLLNPMAKKEFSSSYSSYHQLKKRHMQEENERTSFGSKRPSVGKETSRFGTKYVPLLGSENGTSQSEDINPHSVTSTEIVLADLTES